MMFAVVDLQGFKTDNNDFIVKEIAILCENNQMLVLLIKPPFPFNELSETEKMQVRWIERNRQIYWREGIIPYSNFEQCIADYLVDKTIYVKGYEKISWLKKIIKNDKIFDLEDSPSLRQLNLDYALSPRGIFKCIYHSRVCALKNVTCLKKWLENKESFVKDNEFRL